jgi:hypothetical protein
LHDAVRIGNNNIVKTLLEADPMLANYPEEGTSPLYLAISLENNEIARTLHDMSNGNLSYLGPNGQNALHIASFRGRGTIFSIYKFSNFKSKYQRTRWIKYFKYMHLFVVYQFCTHFCCVYMFIFHDKGVKTLKLLLLRQNRSEIPII